MKQNTILKFSFLLTGLILLIADIQAAVIYFTLVPLHYCMSAHLWRNGNIASFTFSLYFFFAVGLGSVIMYLNKQTFLEMPINEVGNFDFSLIQFYYIYLYVALDLIIIYCLSIRLTKKDSISLIANFGKEEIARFEKLKGHYSILPLSLAILLFSYISVWMYNHKVGITGLHQIALPYHLNGILYYGRRFVFTIVILYLFVKTKNKTIATYLVIIYALIIGVSGSSKSLNLMITFPVGLYNFFNHNKRDAALSFLSGIAIYAFVTCARELIFFTDAQASLSDVFSTAYTLIVVMLSDIDSLVNIVASFFHSLYGMNKVMIPFEYNEISIPDTWRYIFGSHILDIIPDLAEDVYGLHIDEDKAFGVCIGFPGTMAMLARNNHLLLLLEPLIFFILFNSISNSLYYIFNLGTNRVVKYIALGVFLMIFSTLVAANSLREVYLGTFMLLIIRLYIKKCKRESNISVSMGV